MHRKLAPLTTTLLLSALLASGCGGSDKAASDTAPAPLATATTDATSTGTVPAPTSTTSTTLADNPRVKQAIAQCKASIDANPQVKDSIKEDVKAICDKAASGDPREVKKAIREVCEKIVESSLPAGDARDQAKKTCATAAD
jgi:hypothetical protein